MNKTTNSALLFEKAKKLMPGGVNSPVRAFKSVGGTPIFIKKGKGAHIWDVDDIVVKQRLDSMRLIEEFMLLANKCATVFVNDLSKKLKIKLPFIYRVHDIPNKDKMKELAEFVKQFGYTINIEEKNSLRKLLTAIEGKPEEFLINNLLIRSMAKAIYTEKNIGDYSIAAAMADGGE